MEETYGTTDVVVDNFSLTNTTLSNNEFEIEDLAIYPNPSVDSWLVSTKTDAIQSIEVFNLLGTKVMQLNPDARTVNIDATNLVPGMYITKISTAYGTVSRKLIKR
ncbi:T9SS type A sorting domain-containing protein [Winogradskyella eckloniae]|uniref:T9SS type A sorting domain-containing protein n=1 Tax=Winogradskyella eckloniae TaxID=1089306 RepID=UPI001563BA19|nr:T9SS type A sorting domain-containing protein [Winogradskyella eckloniae]NRD18625.1 T9SS type A sorting domain-containing protein [Winogradskyella eckloniae]